jgi:peptidoglycan hydrolase-like protein with peptidoglycan-binding domain
VSDSPFAPEDPAPEDSTAEPTSSESLTPEPAATAESEDSSRAERWAARRGRARRVGLVLIAVVVVAGAAGGAIVAVSSRSDGSSSSGTGNVAAGHAPTTAGTTTATSTTRAPTTSTTRPHIRQPKATLLPAAPAEGLGWGSSGPVVLAVQKRLKQLHFDPGKLDGEYGQDTNYAVTAADKLLGLPRDGRITPAVEAGLDRFKYSAAMPKAEGDRVEINLDTQVLTVFKNHQPILITTTSTGSGEHFCGGTDGCQYAITPAGHFHFQYLHPGWDNGKLGKMWNPYYFNGGIAVHGLQSVPPYPASHGCARIPMDIANYFPSLVTKGESVYVVGTPMKAGNLYVGPAPTTTTTTVPKSTTSAPKKHKPTKKPAHSTTTVPHPTTTIHVTTTSAPKTTTT